MASNLPPGVSVSMIPGNRPADEWHDKFHEALEVPDTLVGDIDPAALAHAINVELQFLANSRGEAFAAGMEESKMQQLEELDSEHVVDSEGILPRCQSTVMNEKNVRLQCERTDDHPGDHYNYSQGRGWSDVG